MPSFQTTFAVLCVLHYTYATAAEPPPFVPCLPITYTAKVITTDVRYPNGTCCQPWDYRIEKHDWKTNLHFINNWEKNITSDASLTAVNMNLTFRLNYDVATGKELNCHLECLGDQCNVTTCDSLFPKANCAGSVYEPPRLRQWMLNTTTHPITWEGIQSCPIAGGFHGDNTCDVWKGWSTFTDKYAYTVIAYTMRGDTTQIVSVTHMNDDINPPVITARSYYPVADWKFTSDLVVVPKSCLKIPPRL